jgi:BirA family biotin operon repressor/biotin-[acetyl-CoA-carboxylase] ligase
VEKVQAVGLGREHNFSPLESMQMRSIGSALLHFHSLESTNAHAVAFAADPANHGLVITAVEQTAGRGQFGRSWSAPPASSVLMSVLLFPPPQLRRPSILTAWAAISVCDMLRDAAGIDTTIKWPNDVLNNGKKLCGILSEGAPRYVVVGIGLNVTQSAADFERLGLLSATSLWLASGRLFDVREIAAALLNHLDSWYERLVNGGIDELEAEWRSRLDLLGEFVVAERMDGAEARGRLVTLNFNSVVLEHDRARNILPPEAIRHLGRIDRDSA